MQYSLLSQESETTDQCATRLKATSLDSGSNSGGWSGVDTVVCVDSTWQQATGIMKVGTRRERLAIVSCTLLICEG